MEDVCEGGMSCLFARLQGMVEVARSLKIQDGTGHQQTEVTLERGGMCK